MKKTRGLYVWMEVTPDEYELPLYVADTARELSELTGAKIDNIISSASKARNGNRKRSRFVRVLLTPEEAMECDAVVATA